MSNRAIVEAFFDAQRHGDLDAVAALMDDAMVMEWPQSGERFQGRTNVLGAMRAQRLRPEFLREPQILGEGGVWTYMVPLRYGDAVQHYIAVVEVSEGRIRHGIGHWAAPFPADVSRAPFASPTAE